MGRLPFRYKKSVAEVLSLVPCAVKLAEEGKIDPISPALVSLFDEIVQVVIVSHRELFSKTEDPEKKVVVWFVNVRLEEAYLAYKNLTLVLSEEYRQATELEEIYQAGDPKRTQHAVNQLLKSNSWVFNPPEDWIPIWS